MTLLSFRTYGPPVEDPYLIVTSPIWAGGPALTSHKELVEIPNLYELQNTCEWTLLTFEKQEKKNT